MTHHNKIPDLPLHLQLDAPALARCSRCGRSTWSPREMGTEDRMPQPDGQPCAGIFESPRP